MTSLQSKSAGALLAALGTRGHSGITCAAHDGDATRLDITVESGAWAVLADGTVLADELASTHIDGIATAGNYRLWLDYVEVAAAYEPVWTLTSITPTPPTPSALDICTVDVGAGGISAVGATEGGLRSLPQQSATATLPAGVPTLRGPYVVDYTDIPHDGDKKTLWVPQVGDVLLQLFPDVQTVVQWNVGDLAIGQSLPAPPSWSWPNGKFFCFAHAGTIGIGGNGVFNGGSCLDSVADAVAGATAYAYGNGPSATGYVFHNTDPVELGIHVPGDTNPTQGHVELYALIARAVAP